MRLRVGRDEKGLPSRIPLLHRRAATVADPGAEFEQVRLAWDEGRQREALTAARQLARRDTLPEGLLELVGRFLLEAGELHAALDCFERLAAAAPARALPVYFLGRVYDGLGRLDDALAAHRRAIELEPDNAECHYRLGVTLSRNERRSDAEASYRRAIALDRRHARAYTNLGFLVEDVERL